MIRIRRPKGAERVELINKSKPKILSHTAIQLFLKANKIVNN